MYKKINNFDVANFLQKCLNEDNLSILSLLWCQKSANSPCCGKNSLLPLTYRTRVTKQQHNTCACNIRVLQAEITIHITYNVIELGQFTKNTTFF